MLSLIEVTCPHCAARGQIMLPPLGAIIIGPCPECSGMVAVFCGQVLPLDNAIMTGGTGAEKRDHVGLVLGNFVQERVARLFSGDSAQPESNPAAEYAEATDFEATPHDGDPRPTSSALITTEEVDSFVNVDLRLLDNPAYFKAIFDPQE